MYISSYKTSQSEGAVVDVYTTAVLSQPQFDDLDGVPGLVPHQKLAKDNAQYWRDTVRQQLYSTNSGLRSYCNLFDAFYDTLYADAGNLDDAKSRSRLADSLNLLLTQVQAQEQSSDAALKVLQDFQRKCEFTHDLCACA